MVRENHPLDLLIEAARLRSEFTPAGAASRSADEHWDEALRDLERLRSASRGIGILALLGFLAAIAWVYGQPLVFLALILYSHPPATVGFLAFFQRFLFGGPTKRRRTHPRRIFGLNRLDSAALPYRLRAQLMRLPAEIHPEKPGPSPVRRHLFILYVIGFAVSELAAQWRAVIRAIR